MPRFAFAFVLLVSLLVPLETAAEPVFFNAELHPLGTPTPDLGRAFASLMARDDGPAWVTYSVPMVSGQQMLCCGGPSMCSLERPGGCCMHRDDDADVARELRVLLRVHKQRLTEIRAFSSDCRLDADGLPVYVWEGVESKASLDFLVDLAGSESRDEAEGALVAVAYHGDGEADRILERIARGQDVPRLEEEAVFWLGEARGDGGFEVLERLRREVRNKKLLEQVAFALHLSDADGALPALIDMAREDSNSEVRSTALFWLSQQAGEQAAAAIVEASEEDPDLEVKESAIFALSQLPPDRGVPLLIRYARTHDTPEIRKKAMFWLGQSEDPRALDFFEEILLR